MTLLASNKKAYCVVVVIVVVVLIICLKNLEQSHTFIKNSPRPSSSIQPTEQCPEHIDDCSKQVLQRNEAPKWIAVWITSEPQKDVSHLTEIPGWKVVVVGDGLRPLGCRYPSCVFLDPVSQAILGASLTSLLPQNDPAKKNLAYLYAIKQKAYYIYDADVNIRPLHSLSDFFLGNTSGLVYFGGNTFNYYKHYGEHWFRPPGFVQIDKEENDPSAYVLSDIHRPEVQCGLVKVKDYPGPRFQSVVPTVFVGSQAWAPFSSGNIMFSRRAFWGLLTLPGRSSDILRSYVLQTMLKYIHGYVGFLHPNAEYRHYTQSNVSKIPSGLVKFLFEWQCKDKINLETCFTQLVSQLVSDDLITENCSKIMNNWLLDLKTFDYSVTDFAVKEPLKLTIKTNKLSHGVSSKSVKFSASPSIYYKNNPQTKTYEYVTKMCPNFSYPLQVPYRFDDIILVISFNYPGLYGNVIYLEAIYRRYFPHILFCGPDEKGFRSTMASLPVNSTVAYVTGVERGWMYFQECTIYAMKMNLNVRGYLQIGDDSLVNPWNIRKLPRDQFWFDSRLRNASRIYNKHEKWIRWPPSSGRVAFDMTFRHIETVAQKAGESLEKRFYKQFIKNVNHFEKAYYETSDLFYIPNRLKEEFIHFTRLFLNSTLLVEAAVPTMMLGLDDINNITRVTATETWLEERNHPEKHFNISAHYLHAFKGREQMKLPNCKKFMCETYLPLLVKRMAETTP